MSALEDDIARIAALRGRSADAYIDANRTAQAIAMRIGPAAVRRSFVLSAMPLVVQLNPIQGQMLRDRFESERAAWNAEVGMPAPQDGARAPGRDTRTL